MATPFDTALQNFQKSAADRGILVPPTYDVALFNALKSKVTDLARDPSNQALRTDIFRGQITLTAKQLGLTDKQAGALVRSQTAAYIYSKGRDPKAVLDLLDSAQQQMMDYDKNKPKIFGMDLVTAQTVAIYLSAAAGPVLFLSIAAFTIALFMIGPEMAAAVAGAGGVVEAMSAVTGVAMGSTGGGALAVGSFLFLISQFLGHMGSAIPMVTNQMVDNGTIVPSLVVSSIANVQQVQTMLQGGQKPGPYDAAQFTALFNGLQAAGFTQLKNPLTGELTPFTRQAFADLINYLYGTAVGSGQPATASKITPQINAWLFKGGSNNPIPLSLYDQVAGLSNNVDYSGRTGSSASNATSAVSPTPVTPTSAPVSNIQIFTGVISGGTLGLPQEFIASPDPMIDSVDELTASARINLAAAVTSLPGRFFYEIAIVNTIRTKSGFVQKGAPVTIVTGYYKNGKPKTKTLYYKFAVMKLGVTDENGRVVKLGTINLGPVNITVFSPTILDLKNVQQTVSSSTFTTDISAIKNVVSQTPPTVGSAPPVNPAPPVNTPAPVVTVAPTPTPAPYVPPAPVYAPPPPLPTVTSSAYGGGISNLNGYTVDPRSRWVNVGGALYVYDGGILNPQSTPPSWAYAEAFPLIPPKPQVLAPASSSGSSPSIPTINASTAQKTNAKAATSLSEFYGDLGQTIPSLDSRAVLYQTVGLGPAGTYVGSADQNNKLLGALKLIYT